MEITDKVFDFFKNLNENTEEGMNEISKSSEGFTTYINNTVNRCKDYDIKLISKRKLLNEMVIDSIKTGAQDIQPSNQDSETIEIMTSFYNDFFKTLEIGCKEDNVLTFPENDPKINAQIDNKGEIKWLQNEEKDLDISVLEKSNNEKINRYDKKNFFKDILLNKLS